MEGPGPGLGNSGFPTCPSVTSGSAFQLCESYPGMPPKRALTCGKENAFAAQKLSSLLHGDLSLSPDPQRRFWWRHAFLHRGLSWWSKTRVRQAVRTVGLLLPSPLFWGPGWLWQGLQLPSSSFNKASYHSQFSGPLGTVTTPGQTPYLRLYIQIPFETLLCRKGFEKGWNVNRNSPKEDGMS